MSVFLHEETKFDIITNSQRNTYFSFFYSPNGTQETGPTVQLSQWEVRDLEQDLEMVKLVMWSLLKLKEVENVLVICSGMFFVIR